MKIKSWQAVTISILVLAAVACRKETPVSDSLNDPSLESHKYHETCTPGSYTVFATGLINPRGLKFGPDGNLYVAEGGSGGSHSTVGICKQVPSISVGPETGSNTGGRISVIDKWGKRKTLVDDLPSSQTNQESGSLVSGVADVAFIGNNLYAILAGAGCSHGVTSLPNGIVKVKSDGSWKLIADLSAYQQANPTKVTEDEDFEPDGTWYSMISLGGHLYAVEPNHGEMVRVNLGGKVTRVIDISATQGHIVPTVVAFRDGYFYVSNLHPFPIVEGSSSIYKISMDGDIKVWATGFTTVLGLDFDEEGNLYVLENTTGAGNFIPTAGTGDIVVVNRQKQKKILVGGLTLPTGMTFGKDGNLYVSHVGFGPPPQFEAGQILKVCVGGGHDKSEEPSYH